MSSRSAGISINEWSKSKGYHVTRNDSNETFNSIFVHCPNLFKNRLHARYKIKE